MPFALKILYHPASSAIGAPDLVAALAALDAETLWGVSETHPVPAIEFDALRRDVTRVRRIAGRFRWMDRPMAFEVEVSPHLLLTVHTPPSATLDEAVRLLHVCAGWAPLDFGSVQALGHGAEVVGSMPYIARAAVHLSGARLRTMGPISPGMSCQAAARVRALAPEWVPNVGTDEEAYREFCRVGLGSVCEPAGKRAIFKPAVRWQAPPALPLEPAPDANALRQLRKASGTGGPVDMEETVIPPNVDLVGVELAEWNPWFLGLNEAAMRWALLDDARLLECGFEGVDFTGSSMTRVSSRASLFTSCNLRGCDLTGAAFEETRAAHAAFARARLEQARFDRCVFESCDFSHAAFEGSSHHNSRYVHCTMSLEMATYIRARGGVVE